MNYYMKDIVTTIKNQTELFDTRDKIRRMKLHNANFNYKNILMEIKVIEKEKEYIDYISLCHGETLDIDFSYRDIRIVSLKVCGRSGQRISYLAVVDYFI